MAGNVIIKTASQTNIKFNGNQAFKKSNVRD